MFPAPTSANGRVTFAPPHIAVSACVRIDNAIRLTINETIRPARMAMSGLISMTLLVIRSALGVGLTAQAHLFLFENLFRSLQNLASWPVPLNAIQKFNPSLQAP